MEIIREIGSNQGQKFTQHPQNRGIRCQPPGPTFVDLEVSLWGPKEGEQVRTHGGHVNTCAHLPWDPIPRPPVR